MSADPHSAHGSAVADPHGKDSAGHGSDPHGNDPHGHDSHGHDSHGSAAGHGHDESPKQTPVPPFEATPWGMIALGILVVAAVVGLGLVRDWPKWIQENPNKILGAPGHGVK